ncbi:RagB/SusD family nutrient uptake outer membrane protein [Prevotella sp. 10(H)]|uniref:RagB/SusD family nutrient uptake outer membrane protein n=1 Tax=Prevotella sp. 10(H) TaxID=1158294 RepID=UPI0004A6F82D|nr:RagB/SusD family nutrient uptake outer membrane protein [Prevotella sp. 10(H)]
MKLIKYFYLLIICFSVSSCADFLDNAPDDQLTLEIIFNDKERTEGWLANIYSGIPDVIWSYAKYIGYDTMSDDLTPSYRWTPWDWKPIDFTMGNWYTDSEWKSNFWNELPQRIRQAYIFIENVHPTRDLSEAEVENMKNEARFLIAYYYWINTNAYGSVPFFDDVVDVNAPVEELMKGQVPFDEMVDWVDGQLFDLSKKLPASYSEARMYGRATSIMCLAVRARMLLFAASPLVNGNPDYAGFQNYDGKERFNSTYSAEKWVRATKACKELIDAAHAAGHKLYYEYNEDGSIDPFMSYQNMMFRREADGNKEILFVRPDCNFGEYEGHATPRGCNGNGGLGVPQSLVDAFFMENGLPPILGYNADNTPIINATSGYSEKGFSTTEEVRNTKWNETQGDGKVTLANTFNMYCHREPRFYVSVLYNGAWFKSEGRTTRFMSGEWDGGPTHDAPQQGYLVRKKYHPETNRREGYTPYRPGIVYRLGEAYLNYAEALNESSPGSADILKYLNLIRERAGVPTYGSAAGQIPAPSGQAAMREAIYRERRVELNNEGIRYDDIRRLKLGEKLLNGDVMGMNFGGTKYSDDKNDPESFFVRTKSFRKIYSKKCYWFPVHQGEIDKDPTLVQAPFWVTK